MHPEPELLEQAARILSAGGLVAFPTETVYGLGANALDEAAVARIFAAKGRPERNPLIVHVASIQAARALVTHWPAEAEALAAAFWPGPLTLVLPKRALIPSLVSAGLDSVGIRIPAHPVALALITLAAMPIAAPSANRYTHISPTTAAHVADGLGTGVDLILDAGPTQVGIESTVVSLLGAAPQILRPGMLGRAELARVAPTIDYAKSEPASDEQRPQLAPGLARKHYAPRARVMVVEHIEADNDHGMTRVGRLSLHPSRLASSTDPELAIVLPAEPAAYAEHFYEALHRLDALGCELIVIEAPPRTEQWHAIWDRLNRARS
ncbi:MAG: threonylcarbamoyl-AMP synthase [Bradymonadaceae bacterium]|nr:threonylcarbamoyl-AMP synthase [Lujinxingiaceae bacterium]